MGTDGKVQVVVNGNTYLVEVPDMTVSPMQVIVNGKPYQVQLTLADETPAVAPSSPVYVPASPAAPPPQSVGAASSNAKAVSAPMPGNIVDVLVKAGDSVSRDQVLCTLEAMKMQNAIRSPRAGQIADVLVAAGQKVGYGDVLLTFA